MKFIMEMKGEWSYMILWFRHLPKSNIDLAEWNPFIKNNWFREHFMKFVYLLQIIILL